MIAHHEATQAAANGWLMLGGASGIVITARLFWSRLRRVARRTIVSDGQQETS